MGEFLGNNEKPTNDYYMDHHIVKLMQRNFRKISSYSTPCPYRRISTSRGFGAQLLHGVGFILAVLGCAAPDNRRSRLQKDEANVVKES